MKKCRTLALLLFCSISAFSAVVKRPEGSQGSRSESITIILAQAPIGSDQGVMGKSSVSEMVEVAGTLIEISKVIEAMLARGYGEVTEESHDGEESQQKPVRNNFYADVSNVKLRVDLSMLYGCVRQMVELNNSSYAAESSLSCSNDAFNPAR